MHRAPHPTPHGRPWFLLCGGEGCCGGVAASPCCMPTAPFLGLRSRVGSNKLGWMLTAHGGGGRLHGGRIGIGLQGQAHDERHCVSAPAVLQAKAITDTQGVEHSSVGFEFPWEERGKPYVAITGRLSLPIPSAVRGAGGMLMQPLQIAEQRRAEWSPWWCC